MFLSLTDRLDMLHALHDSFSSPSRKFDEKEAAEHLIAARNAAVWEGSWSQAGAQGAKPREQAPRSVARQRKNG